MNGKMNLPNDERVPKRIDMMLGSDFARKHLIEPRIGRCSVLSLPTSFGQAAEFDLGYCLA